MNSQEARETFAYADADRRERILTFMESMKTETTPFLRQLEQKALDADVPIIRTQTQSLIQFLLVLGRPQQLLEVGTATGFSALFMLTYAPSGARLISIERDKDRWEQALQNREEAAACGALDDEERCDFRLGDAAELLPVMTGRFDFIFLDAAKGQYLYFLPDLLRLLSPGGILLSDNIFKDGEILESRYAVRRRDRTIHRRMRAYLTALKNHPELQTLLLQEGDGAAVSVKK